MATNAIDILAKSVSDLNEIVRCMAIKDSEYKIQDSAFKERTVICLEQAAKTHHAMFLANGESVISRQTDIDKRVIRLETAAKANRKGDTDITIAWIKVIGSLLGAFVIIGGSYAAYMKYWV